MLMAEGRIPKGAIDVWGVRRVVVLVIAWAVLATMTACDADGAEPTAASGRGSGSAEAPAPPSKVRTLTAETLPTSVGTSWEVASFDTESPIMMTAEGPWTFEVGSGWRVDEHLIVDPAEVPGLDAFENVTFVVKNVDEGATYFYPRTVTDDWLLHLGRIEVKGDEVEAEPLEAPSNFWPLGLDVGRQYLVQDEGAFRIDATVIARNTATTPAGVIEDTCLVRFVYTPRAEGAEGGTYYYMFAPDVGFVALIHPSAGSEQVGFTAADSISVITRLPSE